MVIVIIVILLDGFLHHIEQLIYFFKVEKYFQVHILIIIATTETV